jgi:activator of HSP90 ATPase
MMKKHGESLIREKLSEYIRLLKEEFSQGLILPTKNTINTTNTQSINTSKTIINPQLPTNINKSSMTELKNIQLQDLFKCTKVELFQVFCDMNKVKAFTQNSVSLYDCKKGGFFSLISDNVTGRFLDIVPYDRIDMLWRFKSWPSDHYSRVSLLFHDDSDQTKLIIQQTGVPAQFYDNTKVC